MSDAFDGSKKQKSATTGAESFRIGKKVRKGSTKRKPAAIKAPQSASTALQQIEMQADLEPILEESKAFSN